MYEEFPIFIIVFYFLEKSKIVVELCVTVLYCGNDHCIAKNNSEYTFGRINRHNRSEAVCTIIEAFVPRFIDLVTKILTTVTFKF